MSLDERPSVDPFNHRAPIPRVLRALAPLAALVSFGALICLHVTQVEFPVWLGWLLVATVVGGFVLTVLIRLADWISWRLSGEFVPGLRSKVMDDALGRSSPWSNFAKVLGAANRASVALLWMPGLILIILIAWLVFESIGIGG